MVYSLCLSDQLIRFLIFSATTVKRVVEINFHILKRTETYLSCVVLQLATWCHNAIWAALVLYGIGKMNNNRTYLLGFCSQFDFSINNTFFLQTEKHKVICIHPILKRGHLIDFIVPRKRYLRCLQWLHS